MMISDSNPLHLEYGTPEDLENWMQLVREISHNFPGLETEKALAEHAETVRKFMRQKRAICVKAGELIVGVLLFSHTHNMICCLGVSPAYRRQGVATLLMDEALRSLDRSKEISVCTFRDGDPKGPAPRALYRKFGFLEDALVEELGYPNQLFVLHPTGAERYERQKAINRMVHDLASILADCSPSIYLYGSSVLDDFRLGWSDIDILVLTRSPISEEQAQRLVHLRQTMLEQDPGNLYYRLFEGGMLSLEAFLSKSPDRVVYWGTSGQRITNAYDFSSIDLTELLTAGVLLYGDDVRSCMVLPTYSDLCSDVKRHYEIIRKYVQKTDRSFYSYGWLLDIARCLYTLQTGKIIGKTAAGEWTLEQHLCPDHDVLEAALEVRKAPQAHKNEQTLQYAETLGEPVQRFADVLEKNLVLTSG